MSTIDNGSMNKGNEESLEQKQSVSEEHESHENEPVEITQNTPQFCQNCGFEIHGERFCPNCGTEISGTHSIEKSNDLAKKKNIKIAVIAGGILIIALVVILLAYFIFIPSSKYNKALDALDKGNYDESIKILTELGDYKDAKAKKQEAESMKRFVDLKASLQYAYNLCTADGTSLAADGMSITVDSKDEYDKKGVADIVTIATYLNLPDSLLNEMSNTNALMGKQSETYGNIQVSWSYHPDYGLDVIFKIIY